MGNRGRDRRSHQMLNPQATRFAMPGSNAPRARPPSSNNTDNNNAVIPTESAPEITWSTITFSPAYLEKLRLLCHSEKELKKEGYVLKPLDQNQIRSKLRCIKCGKRGNRKPTNPVPGDLGNRKDELTCDKAAGGCGKRGHLLESCWDLHPELKMKKTRIRKTDLKVNSDAKNAPEQAPSNSTISTNKKKKQSKACQYHTGQVRDKFFTCCSRHVSEEGCIEDEKHELPPADDPELREYWQYYSTPNQAHYETPAVPIYENSRSDVNVYHAPTWAPINPNLPHNARTPRAPAQPLPSLPFGLLPSIPYSLPPPTRYRHALALDCEMGTSQTSECELIRITAVDFFTGAILIDNLVYPSVPMAHWNTRYSGVSGSAMHAAVRRGTAIQGRDRARMAMLQFVGPETVVVVHGGSSDFQVLRWIHPLVIDTFILEGYVGHAGAKQVEDGNAGSGRVEGSGRGGKSLKDLCKRKLGIDVQTKGNLGHDSYEDAMATRELVLGWMSGIPDV